MEKHGTIKTVDNGSGIRDEDIIREVDILEREIRGMRSVTKVEFLKLLDDFKKRLSKADDRFEIPECLMR